ncbi:hypothetical protein [Ruminococcus albus]|uniref:hypothetical protein n=1 Tax=Ruminococcus albus TaxID=1264 RepID=UPI000464DBF0|nr:hypothetical protein [Ruminococcus albus]
MYNFRLYANGEISARVLGTAGYRGFSGTDTDGIRSVQRLCKCRTVSETAVDMSAISALNRAEGVFY